MSAGAIGVFGSSEPAQGEPLYELARQMGGLLARAGHRVVSGGYGGVMEGASRGAAEAGGQAVGVVCSSFRGRTPNPYLTEVRETPNLHERTRLLVELSEGFVVLPGKSGTLAELALLWALHRAGGLDRRPVVLLGESWRRVLDCLDEAGILERAELEISPLAVTPEDAMSVLATRLRRAKES